MEFFRSNCWWHQLCGQFVQIATHVHVHTHSCIPHFHTYSRLLVYSTFFLQYSICIWLWWKMFPSEREHLVIQRTEVSVITHSELSRRRRLISENGIKWQLKVLASKLSPPSVWHRSFQHVPAHYLVGRGELQLDVICGNFTRESGRADCLVQCSNW